MAEQSEPRTRAAGWQAEHARRYIETNGEEGHIWNGVPTLLLTTTGRRSGKQYVTPLIYGRDGDRLLVVASKGGAATHPDWYRNLVAQPEVQVQVGADRFRAIARPATTDEKPRLWRIMTKVWPAYDEYQTKTTRAIPVVILERS